MISTELLRGQRLSCFAPRPATVAGRLLTCVVLAVLLMAPLAVMAQETAVPAEATPASAPAPAAETNAAPPPTPAPAPAPAAAVEPAAPAAEPTPAPTSSRRAEWVVLTTDGAIYYSVDQKEFQKAEVPAGTPRLRAVTYAVRHFVAVGDAGTVLLSPNGVDWAPQKSDVDVTLRGITYGRQKFVAVGDDGVIISSADGGKTWAKTTSGTTANLNAIAFVSSVRSNVRFFTAVGAGGTVLTSRNGKEWFKQPIEGTDTFVAVVAKGNAYVASDKGVVYASDEDASFSRRESGIGLAPIGMVSGNGLFMAADASGNVAVSRDFTKSWDRAMAARGKAEGILYADDKFVLMGPGLLASSADGNAWTPMPQPEGSPSFAAATSYTLGPPSDEEPQDSSVLKKHDQPKWVQNLPAPIRNNIGYVFTGLGIAAVFITIMMFREGKAKPKSTRKLAPGERANLPPLPIDSPILRVFENTNPMRVKINTGPFLPFEFRDPWLVVDEMNLDLTDAEPVYKHERTRFLLNNRSVIEFKEVEFDGKRSMWDT